MAEEKAARARGALDHLGAAGRLRHVGGEREQLLDDAAVRLDRLRRVGLAGVRVLPDGVERDQLVGDLDGVLPHTAQSCPTGRRPRCPWCSAGNVSRARLVFSRADLMLKSPVALGSFDGGPADWCALLLERRGQVGGLLRHLGEQLHVVELLDVVQGLGDAQRTQRGARRPRGARAARPDASRMRQLRRGYSRAGTRRSLALHRAGDDARRGPGQLERPSRSPASTDAVRPDSGRAGAGNRRLSGRSRRAAPAPPQRCHPCSYVPAPASQPLDQAPCPRMRRTRRCRRSSRGDPETPPVVVSDRRWSPLPRRRPGAASLPPCAGSIHATGPRDSSTVQDLNKARGLRRAVCDAA